jgi:hypothetical protein
MMRRIRERAPAFCAPLTASLVRATARVFPLLLGFGKNVESLATACHLLGPKRTLLP